jgi:hypothetical protein
MGDESGAAGLAKGLGKSLHARMWDGIQWRQPGQMLGQWLTCVIKAVPHTCPYCRAQIDQAIRAALTQGPTVEDIEKAGVVNGQPAS